MMKDTIFMFQALLVTWIYIKPEPRSRGCTKNPLILYYVYPICFSLGAIFNKPYLCVTFRIRYVQYYGTPSWALVNINKAVFIYRVTNRILPLFFSRLKHTEVLVSIRLNSGILGTFSVQIQVDIPAWPHTRYIAVDSDERFPQVHQIETRYVYW